MTTDRRSPVGRQRRRHVQRCETVSNCLISAVYYLQVSVRASEQHYLHRFTRLQPRGSRGKTHQAVGAGQGENNETIAQTAENPGEYCSRMLMVERYR